MAPAAAYIAALMFAVGTTAYVAAEVVIEMVFMFAASFVIGKLVGKSGLGAGALTSANPLQMSRNPIASRRIIYGRTRVSGTLVFANLSGAKNSELHYIVTLAGHECDGIENCYFNDQMLTIDGSGNVVSAVDGSGNVTSYGNLARLAKHLGAADQLADAELVAACPSVWTTDHRLRSIAYLYAHLTYDASLFPASIPALSAIVRGRQLYDPRTGLTGWSANPALCLRDYLTNTTYGMSAGADEIDDASFIASANICDEPVTLPDTTTEMRYTVNGCFDLSASPSTILENLCGAMVGALVHIGGKWVCHAGAHQIPTVTLDEGDLRGGISVQTKMSVRDICNGVKGTFPCPAENWQGADFPAVQSSEAITEDGGIELWKDLDLPLTTSAWTAQRLATIELNRTRQDITATLPCKLTGLQVQAGDTVMVNNTRLGWTAKIFLVTELKFAIDTSSSAPSLGVDLTLRETAAELWEGAQVLEYDPAPNTNLPNPFQIDPPSGLTLTCNASTAVQQADGTFVPRLKVAWIPPSDGFVQSGGLVAIQYRRQATPALDWSNWATIAGDQTSDFITDIAVGATVEVRVRSISCLGVNSAWTDPAALAILGDLTAPAAPTALAASGVVGGIQLTWSNPADADFAGIDVFEASGSSPAPDANTAPSFQVGAVAQWTRPGLTSGTTRWYWIRARDNSRNASGWVGPQGAVSGLSNAEIAAQLGAASAALDDLDASLAAAIAQAAGTSSALARTLALLIASQNDQSAAVATLSEAFIDATGRAIARWGLRLEAGDVITGIEAVAQDGPEPVSAIRLLANIFELVATVEGATITPFLVDSSAGRIYLGLDVQSDNYVAGVSGYQIRHETGDVEFGSGVFRGSLQAAKVATDSVFFNPETPANTFPAFPCQAGDLNALAVPSSTPIDTLLMTFYGWSHSSGAFGTRYGRAAMSFRLDASSNCSTVDGTCRVIYRVNGGAWQDSGIIVVGTGVNNILAGVLPLTGLTGAGTVDFGLRFWSVSGDPTTVNFSHLAAAAYNI